MIQIPTAYLDKYGMTVEDGETAEQSMAHYESEKEWLQVFLSSSDYIANKIIEAQYSGEPVEDLKEIVAIRKQCRDRIREINEELNEESE